jgi:hypothetical protein
MLHDLIVSLYGESTYRVLVLVFKLYPLWLPFLSGVVFWETWVRYVRYTFFTKVEMVLLEVKVPREVFKSPLAMETVLTSFYQLGQEGTLFEKYWKGQTRAFCGLEIVVRRGEIHFYMWIRKGMQDLVEAALYSQYPEIEITQALDYTKSFDYIPGQNNMWGTFYIYSKPNAFPIKTYIDYGLDKDPKEEFKHDPLTQLLEFMGSSTPPDHELWLQFAIRAHRKEKRLGFLSPKTDWREEAEAEIKNIHEKMKADGRVRLSPGETEQVFAIERSLGKFPFDVGMRVIYVVPNSVTYHRPVINGLKTVMNVFGSNNLNKFGRERGTEFDYPWEDFGHIRVNRRKRKLLDAYKRRMHFYYPYKYGAMVMTNEELATLFHFPGQVGLSPHLPRIPSKKAQAPINLPI